MARVVVDLGGVLFEVDVVDADELRPGRRLDRHAATDAERCDVFGNLVVLRHVRVEVVPAVERGAAADVAAKHHACHDRELHGLLVRDRKRAGVAQANGADIGVRLASGLQQAAAEHLRPRLQLDVRLKSYCGEVFHGRALLMHFVSRTVFSPFAKTRYLPFRLFFALFLSAASISGSFSGCSKNNRLSESSER